MSNLPAWVKCLCLGTVTDCWTCKASKALSIAWEALESATKPKGRFSNDQEQHALNVIEDMAEEAKEALRRIEELGK